MQGCRNEMEDEHCVEMELENHPKTTVAAIFDGHAGNCFHFEPLFLFLPT